MLDYIIERTNKYIEDMPKKDRKKYGQFFTSKETACFMAELYNIPENLSKIRILDAGAGSGILSCALLERLERTASVQTIELTCYENDDNILGLLRENLHMYQTNSKKIFELILLQIIILQASIWTSTICWAAIPNLRNMILLLVIPHI